ncbi:M14 family zinc carboxypeptidase [Lutimonas zeaxanthinifaciens]|uniref:M14 family zinc carboxypeptidase n=1 Tax=Lutimonas zeaxanthinifaciens TaxID=3060215 RepID=UPI00265C91AD|nr:M14 family zinc carboxypeptidase [Lutimonas sp. YSD2104]WKK66566.1 M14 family zinc carboxypeptidase [Lutimonas sp. YSD2104]
MNLYNFALGVLLFIFYPIQAQDYYFEEFQPFNDRIPSPEEFLGYPIGEYHTRHDLVVAYIYTLAELSDRASVYVYGKTHENRKLLLLQVSEAGHIANLEELKRKHLEVVDPSTKVGSFKELPLFVNLAYGVHGNEPSSTEAAMLMAYTLVASENQEIKNMRRETVVFIDPTINPDGRDRHSNWANSYKGSPLIADKFDIEHNESWPRGRTNHYLFDLNRDLLLGVNPETQGRLKWYHEWYPNVVTDFHEMGTNSTYFFEPKNKSASMNPITPSENRDVLNKVFQDQFAEDLDKIGSFYFTDEIYDSTYPGYGSTYMDLQGSLALLFEQASSRGHLQETTTGEISFPFTIRNQYVSSIATLRAAVGNKDLLYDYQNRFFADAMNKAGNSKVKGYVFGDPYDKGRVKAFIDVLLQHQIEVFPLGQKLKTAGIEFKPDHSYVVPVKQKQYYMVQSLFETFEKYRDSVFYDASAWSVVNFYNMKYKPLDKLPSMGEKVTPESNIIPAEEVVKSEYAYLIPYEEYYAPAVLYHIQNRGLVVKASSKDFSMNTKKGLVDFKRGTLLVPVYDQFGIPADSVYQWVKEACSEFSVKAYSVSTGMTQKGNGLGSGSFKTLTKPSAMLVVGGSVRSYEAGEVWHLFENRMKMPLVKVPEERFYLTDIYRYNVIIMVSGNYLMMNKKEQNRLKQWVADGNTLITIATASSWVIKQKIAEEKLIVKKKDSLGVPERTPYADAKGSLEKQYLGGAIFGIDLDITHPVAYGYQDKQIPVYKNNRVWISPSKNAFSTVGKYRDDPHIDGYISAENLEKMKHSASIIVSKRGKGRIILFADNPNFRGAWYGTNKLFMNAVHFGSLVRVPQ